MPWNNPDSLAVNLGRHAKEGVVLDRHYVHPKAGLHQYRRILSATLLSRIQESLSDVEPGAVFPEPCRPADGPLRLADGQTARGHRAVPGRAGLVGVVCCTGAPASPPGSPPATRCCPPCSSRPATPRTLSASGTSATATRPSSRPGQPLGVCRRLSARILFQARVPAFLRSVAAVDSLPHQDGHLLQLQVQQVHDRIRFAQK